MKRFGTHGALGLGVVALLALPFGGAVAQDDAAAETTREELPVAVQMYTLRDYGSFEEQLELASSVGYDAIETVGTHGLSADEMNALLDEHGLDVVSSHVGLDVLRSDLAGVIEFNRAVGNDTIVMPYLGEDARPQDAAGWQELGRELGDIGARLQEEGLQLAYHNHDFEMVEIDGRLALDHLLGAADPENLMWQADVAWIARGGQDPAGLLERYAGRVASIHAKDNAPEGENQDQRGFADVGHGVIDWDAVLPAARDAGVDWYIVEHDMPADHERSITRSYEYLTGSLPGVLSNP